MSYIFKGDKTVYFRVELEHNGENTYAKVEIAPSGEVTVRFADETVRKYTDTDRFIREITKNSTRDPELTLAKIDCATDVFGGGKSTLDKYIIDDGNMKFTEPPQIKSIKTEQLVKTAQPVRDEQSKEEHEKSKIVTLSDMREMCNEAVGEIIKDTLDDVEMTVKQTEVTSRTVTVPGKHYENEADAFASKIFKVELTNKESEEAQTNLDIARNSVVEVVDTKKFNRFTFNSELEVKLIRTAKRDRALLLTGLPGGGKTVWAKYLAYKITGDTTSNKIEVVQFSPSTGYGNFMEGLEPNSKGQFEIVKSTFLKLCEKASENPDKDYVIVLDELNRCKVTDVLGEMLNMIEARGEYIRTNNGLLVTMPGNIIVIATMNQFDSGANDLPYALRSRFAEYEITGADADIKKLIGLDVDKEVLDAASDIWGAVLKLNEYITNQRKTSAYNIGPRQFGYGIKTIEDLQDTVETRIIPSLKLVLRTQYENDDIVNEISLLQEFVETGKINEEYLSKED